MEYFIRRAAFVLAFIAIGQIGLYFYLTPGSTLVRNARMGEWKKAGVREACFEALERLTDPNLPRYPSDFTTVEEVPRAREMTAALHCYMVTKKDAVCDPDNRAYIVDYIGKYYSKMDTMLASAKRKGPEQLKMMQMFWSSRHNQTIASTIDAAIRDGKLNKSDFGWSAPDALKPALDRYATVPDRCTPVRAASRS